MLVKWSPANALELILAKLTFNYVFLRNHGDLSLGMETTLNSCDKQGNAASETEFFASRSMYWSNLYGPFEIEQNRANLVRFRIIMFGMTDPSPSTHSSGEIKSLFSRSIRAFSSFVITFCCLPQPARNPVSSKLFTSPSATRWDVLASLNSSKCYLIVSGLSAFFRLTAKGFCLRTKYLGYLFRNFSAQCGPTLGAGPLPRWFFFNKLFAACSSCLYRALGPFESRRSRNWKIAFSWASDNFLFCPPDSILDGFSLNRYCSLWQ